MYVLSNKGSVVDTDDEDLDVENINQEIVILSSQI